MDSSAHASELVTGQGGETPLAHLKLNELLQQKSRVAAQLLHSEEWVQWHFRPDLG
jgi:hypothetical protein